VQMINTAQMFEESDPYSLFLKEIKEIAMLLVDPNGKIISWNKGAERLFGFNEQEALGQNYRLIFSQPDQENGVPEQEIEKALKDGQAEKELWYKRKDEVLFFAQGTLRPVYNGQKLVAFGKILRDLSRQQSLEQKLKALVEQEKSLNQRLRLATIEINHRVNNNLQLISSLLSLQLRKQGNISRADLDKITKHIQGLGAMHDLVCSQIIDDCQLDTISAKKVLEKLIKINSNNMDRTIRAELEDIKISPKQCSSLAIIFNELLSNSFKHGAKKVDVRLKIIDNDLASFEVIDDAPGLLENSGRASGEAGSVIVNTLCKADFLEIPCYENRAEEGARVSFKIHSRSISL